METLVRKEWLALGEADTWEEQRHILRERLEALGLTQEWLARELGRSFTTVNHWLSGKHEPTVGDVRRTARVLAQARRAKRRTRHLIQVSGWFRSMVPTRSWSPLPLASPERLAA